MNDSFEFTLHDPLTQEDWNKILDVEHENTKSVTFQTPQGRQVKYIKAEVLDKIRAEIEELDGKYVIGDYATYGEHSPKYVQLMEVLQIIDKYRAERSGEK